jgi:capsular exopolysaccharide synthesis family protein
MNLISHEVPRIAAKPSDAGGQTGLNVHTVLNALRCWWKLAAPIGLVLAVAAGLAVKQLVKPTYTAATWIEIRERGDYLLSAAGPEDPRKFVQNQLELMKSPLVLDSVAAIPAIASTPEIADGGEPALALRRLLRIRAQGQSDFFVIEFTSVSPEKAALITREVAKSYLKVHRSTLSSRYEQTVSLLEDLQRTQHGVVQKHRDDVQGLTQKLTGKDPFAAEVEGKKLLAQDPLVEMKSLLLTQQVKNHYLSMDLQAEKEQLAKQSFAPSPAEVERRVAAHPTIGQLEKDLADLQLKAKGYEATSKRLDTDPLYKSIKRQIADKEAMLKSSTADLQKQIHESLEKTARATRDDELRKLEEELAKTESSIQYLQDKLNTEVQARTEFKGETLDLEFTRNEYERSAKVFDTIAGRLLNLRMEREAPERVAIFREATAPTSPDEAMPYKQMGVMGLGAFAIPFGLAIAFELLYRRVGSRDQLEALGKVRVVGEVPSLPRRARSRKSQGGAADRQLQLFEESVDGLRTYLTLVESLRGMQVLAVTSAISREGKTSLAAQLAVSVASASGESTLLIDGDMRSPDMHRIFGVDSSPGLAEVLAGKCPVEEAIETDFSPSLHLLTAGQLASNPHRLAGNGEFAVLLDKLRGMYRYIVVDTPPILPASEALVMARAADAAVLCARRDYSRVDQVAEAYGRLQAAGVKTAGAVLNGIPARSYAQRYGSYYYTRNAFTPKAEQQEASV